MYIAVPQGPFNILRVYGLWWYPLFHFWYWESEGFPGEAVVKNLPVNAEDARDVGSISGSGRPLELLLFSHPVAPNSLRPPWTAADQASLSLTISWSLLKFMSIALVMPSRHLILWCPLVLPSICPSIRDFSNESAVCIRRPVLEFQLQHQSFQWVFKIDFP